MKLVYALFACSIIVVSCKKAKIPVLTETYSREGIQFSYPKGWQVSSDETFQEGKTRTRLINLDMLNGEAIFQVIVLYSETDESFFLSTIDSMRGKKKEFFTRNNPETKVIEDGIEALNENLPKGVVLAAREKYTVDYKAGKFTYLNRFIFRSLREFPFSLRLKQAILRTRMTNRFLGPFWSHSSSAQRRTQARCKSLRRV